MSEVRRWKLKGFIPGIEGESKAVFQPTVVLAEDYDAALAREAAERLRADVAVADCNEAERREAALQTSLDAVTFNLDKADKALLALQNSEAALREELATSRAAFKEELDGVKYTRRKFRQERDALQQRLTDAEQKLGEAYECGYIDGQNSPNGYSNKADRDKCVAELLKPEEGS